MGWKKITDANEINNHIENLKNLEKIRTLPFFGGKNFDDGDWCLCIRKSEPLLVPYSENVIKELEIKYQYNVPGEFFISKNFEKFKSKIHHVLIQTE